VEDHAGGELQFSIKSLGDYTTALTQLPVGTQAKIEGPFGEFTYGYGSHSQIWIAGGIGVTPFVSMAEDLLGKQVIDYTIDFFYSARSEHDGVYRELFTKVQTKHPSFVFHFMPSDTAGFVTGESVIKTVPDTYKRDIFICGPPPMMSALTTSLVTSGVSLDRIRSERFSLLK
jgi:predicted ferric reductase